MVTEVTVEKVDNGFIVAWYEHNPNDEYDSKRRMRIAKHIGEVGDLLAHKFGVAPHQEITPNE